MSLAPKFLSDEDMPYTEDSSIMKKVSSEPYMPANNSSVG